MSCQRKHFQVFDLAPSASDNSVNGANVNSLKLENCVHVFYDKTPPVGFNSLGKIYAVNLLNLLGHFSEFQRHLTAVEDYKSGDINKCGVNILIDTNYFSIVPAAFISDFLNTQNQVAWVGGNSWKLGANALKTIFGVQFNAAEPYTKLDWNNLINLEPSYFKNVQYKGETFYKYGNYGQQAPYLDTFYAAFEISKFDYNSATITDFTGHKILAEIEHNYSLEKRPWALQSRNKFLFSEVPFSFIHEADRYFVFTDLLFDILKATPRHTDKPAVIRIEDVHGEVSISSLEKTRAIFEQNAVKPHIAIIPIFNNPLNANDVYVGQGERPITMNLDFMAKITEFKLIGAEFIWHGVTHQLGNKLNPWESTSGTDYEFWDFTQDVENNQTPLVGRQVPNETPESLVTRFKKGSDVLEAANIHPQVWLTPHYHGSSLSNYVFGQLFNWNIGRVVYYENSMRGLDLNGEVDYIKFPNVSESAWQKRYNYLKTLKVEQNVVQNGQLFPFEIYGDVYGQRLFPENIGNVNVNLSVQVIKLRSVDDILTDARRNLVLRDVWASAFYHPYLLDKPNWDNSINTLTNNDLNKLIVGLKNLGYNFISLEGKSTEWKSQRAPKIIYH